MIITRNHLPGSGPISRAQLDSLGDIQIEFDADDVETIGDDVRDALGNGVAGINYLKNADMRTWTAGVGPTALPANIRTTVADSWWARPDAGAYPTGERSEDTAHQQYLYATILRGATSCTQLDLGQEITAAVAANLHPTATLTLEVENLTGSALTPVVRVDTCDAFENYSAVTNQLAVSTPTSAASAERKTWEIELNLAAFGAALRRGALIYVRFPGLTATTKYVKVYAMKLESGSTATPIAIERDVPGTSTSGGGGSSTATERDYFSNGNLSVWHDSTLTCTEDVDNYAARDWFAYPSDGDTLVYARSVDVPNTGSLYSALLTGHADVSGTVDFGTLLLPATASGARRQVTFSAQIFNGTGASIVPAIRVDTFSSPLALRSATNRLDAPLQPCASGGWTTISYTFNGADLADIANGARVYVRLGAGSLNDAGKYVRFAQLRLEAGSTASTFLPVPLPHFPANLNGASRNLRASRTDATHIAVSYDELIVKDGSGRALFLRSGSHTVNLATTGLNGVDDGSPDANTWYQIYVCSSGVATGVFISKDSPPLLPDGHLYHAKVGEIRLNGSTQVPEFNQLGNTIHVPSANVFTGVNAAVLNTWEDVTGLDAFVPPSAVEFLGIFGTSSGTDNGKAQLAGSGTGTGEGTGVAHIGLFETGGSAFGGFFCGASVRVPFLTAQAMKRRALAVAIDMRLNITGYVLP